jgi:Kef-type K+ transport system membrane component KefB
LFVVRLASKLVGVGLIGSRFVEGPIHYVSWLMATALSFGVIFAQVGLSTNLIDPDQFSILVMIIVMSAVIPTIVAERLNPWGEKSDR